VVGWEQAVGKPNPSVRVVKDQPLGVGGVRRRRRAADDGHGREPGVVRPLVLADPEEAGELRLLVPQRRPLADHGLPVPAVHGQKELAARRTEVDRLNTACQELLAAVTASAKRGSRSRT
jgi:hypothetical protein